MGWLESDIPIAFFGHSAGGTTAEYVIEKLLAESAYEILHFVGINILSFHVLEIQLKDPEGFMKIADEFFRPLDGERWEGLREDYGNEGR